MKRALIWTIPSKSGTKEHGLKNFPFDKTVCILELIYLYLYKSLSLNEAFVDPENDCNEEEISAR